MLPLTPDESLRFWSRVNKTDSCWLWTGAVSNMGYGTFNSQSKKLYAHRVAFMETHGSLDGKMVLDHICHTPLCVRPEHLEQVAHRQNSENRSGAARHSSTGVRGVSPKRGKFRAQIAIAGRPTHLGTFETVAAAELCVIEARRLHYTNSRADLA